MPQLLVRNIEPAVVRKLRRQATAEGVSMEEAHRRVLRKALLGETDSARDFLAYLRKIPGGDGAEFSRASDRPRDHSF
ncbi:MAG: DNA-binding protein [Opitutaceae bacterium]|nr:DNA-binding protein [Opitutaceae bacterium]